MPLPAYRAMPFGGATHARSSSAAPGRTQHSQSHIPLRTALTMHAFAASSLCRRLFVPFALFGGSAWMGACAHRVTSPPTTIYVVRHAEKDTFPHVNPPLSAAGRARAESLAVTLREAGITVIVATDQLRTQQTAAPLAAALHITPASVAMDGTKPEEHIRAVVAAVRRTAHAGDVVLVVDHQSTLPGIIAALGARRPATMCDVEFSNLYVLTSTASGSMGLTRTHYGAPDPAHDTTCRITPRSPP
jgi:broad specificity phosphatase PhoE